MTGTEALARLREVLDQTKPHEHLTAFKAFLAATPSELRELLAAGYELYRFGIDTAAAKRHIVVVLIHGIRTQAIWQEQARAVLENPGKVSVFCAGYEYFDVVRFLGPFRHGPISKVQRELRDIRHQYPNSELVVVAHSFGTYVISKILREDTDIPISRLLLCGSIIPPKYRWDQNRHALDHTTCVNEVGTKDFWPVLAKVASLGYGCSGSFGFKTSRVRDRFFNYGHSDFFTEQHFTQFWRPFVWAGDIAPSPWDKNRPSPPLWISLLGGTPLAKAILILLLLGFLFFSGT